MLVERDNPGVRLPHQQLDLRHASFAQPPFARFDHVSANTAPANVGMGGHVVEPPAMTIVTPHQAPDNPPGLIYPDQRVRTASALRESTVRRGVVVVNTQSACSPQADHPRL